MRRITEMVVPSFFFAVVIMAVSPANALPLFSQPLQADAPSIKSSLNQKVADNFVLDEDAIVTDLHWWGDYRGFSVLPTDNFEIGFYTEDGSTGKPNLIPFVELTTVGLLRADTGLLTPSGSAIYQFDAFLSSPVPISGNTTYYVSIYNNLASEPPAWEWSGSTAGDVYFSRDLLTSGPWSTVSGNMAFELTADAPIPEPATMLLLGTGLVGFAVPRIRRKLKK